MLKPKIHDGCRSREVFSVKAQEKYFTKRGTILAQSSFALRNYLFTTAVGFRFPQLERYEGTRTLPARIVFHLSKVRPNVVELPIAGRGLMALKTAVEKVIVEHARQGLPIYIWRDGEVVEVPLDKLREQATLLEAEPSWKLAISFKVDSPSFRKL